MEWYLDPAYPGAPLRLREELVEYLERHARAGADIEGAKLAAWELMTNAMRHARGPVWVSLTWTEEDPLLEVHDLGPGFSLEEVDEERAEGGGWGLGLASRLARELQVSRKEGGGSRVSARLRVSRRDRAVPVPRTLRGQALPRPDEASEEGMFGKEAFLRALVVELARNAEFHGGPGVAEDLVTRVGLDVGGRMEEAFRRARRVVGRLTPRQVGELYVELKRAIEGDFYVIEASEEKVVLGNRRCPFGDEFVRRAPALCRMTSSVFGGIAARSYGSARVVLEERIAAGDPRCLVTVWLGEAAETAGPGHLYLGDGAARPASS